MVVLAKRCEGERRRWRRKRAVAGEKYERTRCNTLHRRTRQYFSQEQRIPPPQPKQIPQMIQLCHLRYRYFTEKNIDRISTYKNKRCILGVFHPSCNAFLIVFIAPPRDLTQHSYRPIVKQPHFVKQLN